MLKNFTEIAKQTIFFAKSEAAQLGSPEIGTEHILLALLRDEDLTSRLMEGLHISEIREDILAHALRRQELLPPVDLPLSTQSRELLATAEKEAEKLAHRQVSNSHILLGLLRVGESYAAQLLGSRGLSPDRVRSLIAVPARLENVRTANLGESLGSSAVATELAAHPDLRRLLQTIIPQVKELESRGEQRSAMKLLDDLMAEEVPERSLRIRYLAPLATTTALAIGDLLLVKHYCELRLANDPDDVQALYGMADCLVKQRNPDEARPYIAKCYELVAARGSGVRQEFIELLQRRFPEGKLGS
jgi:hypothetical protein